MRKQNAFGDNGFEAWGGYMQAKIAKLEDQFSTRAGNENLKSNIFTNISIYVNGYTKPSADELKVLMVKHGGIYHTYQRPDDYVIAANLADTKVKKMSLHKVVRPEWITESIAAGALLDFRNYLLYGAPRGQTKILFAKSKTEASVCNNSKEGTSLNDISVKSEEASDLQDVTNNSTALVNYKACDVKTAVDTNFISEFYNNSRLHHISQLSASFKQHINNLRENSNFTFEARQDLKNKCTNSIFVNQFKEKIIMHIDMDCFFVSVGVRHRPELIGKSVAVTHSRGHHASAKRTGVNREAEFKLYREMQAKKLSTRTGIPTTELLFNMHSRVDNIDDEGERFSSMSEIASCSYEARAKGIKNGMFMGNALRLCPDLIPIPYDFEAYQEVAYTLYNTVAQYTLDIEAVSCDEMYVDCLGLLSDINISVEEFATMLRKEIKQKTGCPCSTGFGSNRLQARLATKKAKPDGQFFLFADLVREFILDIKLTDLPGVGSQTAQKLQTLGYTTCGSLQELPINVLQQHLGQKTGKLLFQQCRGEDSNPLTLYSIRKSVSAEVNYGIRFTHIEQCFQFLNQLSTEVHKRMANIKLIGKCITLKLMVRAEDAPVETAKFMGHGFCNIINKSVSLNKATDDAQIICKEVIEIIKKLKVDPKDMRGIGIQVTKLEKAESIAEVKGALNKYFGTKADSKSATKSALNENRILRIEENKSILPIDRTSFPTVNQKDTVLKSPVKRRGRPPKLMSPKVLAQTSTSVIQKFFKVELQKKYFSDSLEQPLHEPDDPTTEIPGSDTDEAYMQTISLDNMKTLVRAWVDNGILPLPCDVDTMTIYLKQMVLQKNLNDLVILLRMLQRKTADINNIEWLTTSNRIIKDVQNTMLAVYGKRLFIG